MYLINMIRNRGPVLVKAMAGECSVTSRTIYRDMNSLMRLNFPVYYNNGYRLARDVGFPFGGPDRDDVELIGYALRNNPLTKHPFFKQRFRVIEEKIQSRPGRAREKEQGSLFLFERTNEAIEKNKDSEIIAKFLQAIFQRRKILLTPSDGHTGVTVCTPLAVKLRQAESYLVAMTDEKLLMEEPVAKVESLGLTEEKFVHRPLNLLRREASAQKSVDEI